jgi:hypothetical protein
MILRQVLTVTYEKDPTNSSVAQKARDVIENALNGEC